MGNQQTVPSIDAAAPVRASIERVLAHRQTVSSVPDNLHESDWSSGGRKRKGLSTDNALSKLLFASEKVRGSDIEIDLMGSSVEDGLNNGDDFGWFQDFENTGQNTHNNSTRSATPPLTHALTLPVGVSAPPQYILDSSLETQQLWYHTAGLRPKQPAKERNFFERLWFQNFQRSEVTYDDSLEKILTRSSSWSTESVSNNNHGSTLAGGEDLDELRVGDVTNESDRKQSHKQPHLHQNRQLLSDSEQQQHNEHTVNPDPIALIYKGRIIDNIPKSEIHGEILFRGSSPFSNSIARSFMDSDISSITLQMPYFRVIRSLTQEVYAEFLVKITIGSGSTVTFGIWKRHSEFQQFANLIAEINSLSDYAPGCFKNALLSWDCVIQRKRWFKSLDREYLTIKCFLLERFMQDVLFESPEPEILTSFLGLE
jgi:hypothetical protein